jgi:hypothetical protein
MFEHADKALTLVLQPTWQEDMRFRTSQHPSASRSSW